MSGILYNFAEIAYFKQKLSAKEIVDCFEAIGEIDVYGDTTFRPSSVYQETLYNRLLELYDYEYGRRR
jgi:hypothetical protein